MTWIAFLPGRHAVGCCPPRPDRISFPSNSFNVAGIAGMALSTEERIKELTKGMLRKKLYVILSKGGATPEQIGALLPQHLEYMIGLEKAGVLFASGPLTDSEGKMRGDGLTVIRAANTAEARSIADRDPFVVN